jgi:cytochrome bd-type quinol oxidase subunit 2
VTGYLIAVGAFLLPFVFGLSGLGRPRVVLSVGVALGIVGYTFVSERTKDSAGQELFPPVLLVGLVVLLYIVWCGGLWIGLRLRRSRAT